MTPEQEAAYLYCLSRARLGDEAVIYIHYDERRTLPSPRKTANTMKVEIIGKRYTGSHRIIKGLLPPDRERVQLLLGTNRSIGFWNIKDYLGRGSNILFEQGNIDKYEYGYWSVLRDVLIADIVPQQ